MTDTNIRLLTLVSNAGGLGPGHSAILLKDTVYSFENANDWLRPPWAETSGWIEVEYGSYLLKNSFRPMIIQTLNAKVNRNAVVHFITRSQYDDDDFLSSGVCSSMAGRAIQAGLGTVFECAGIDTPKKVYDMARNRGIVDSERMVWEGRSKLAYAVQDRIWAKLAHDYPTHRYVADWSTR